MGRDADGNLRAADPKHYGKWIGVGMIVGGILAGALLIVNLLGLAATADDLDAWVQFSPKEQFGIAVGSISLLVTGIWKIRDSIWRNRLNRPSELRAPRQPFGPGA